MHSKSIEIILEDIDSGSLQAREASFLIAKMSPSPETFQESKNIIPLSGMEFTLLAPE